MQSVIRQGYATMYLYTGDFVSSVQWFVDAVYEQRVRQLKKQNFCCSARNNLGYYKKVSLMLPFILFINSNLPWQVKVFNLFNGIKTKFTVAFKLGFIEELVGC